jgi:tRNA (guanine37-N1)-methyltransferase
MRIDFVTLFPEQILGALAHSVIARGVSAGVIEFHTVNPRDFTEDRHRTVDDSPFGGGPGMVMMAEPIHRALLSLGLTPGEATVVMPDPAGFLFTQGRAVSLAVLERVVFVCGHYEGIDDRVRAHWGAIPLRLGDFVLTGGELPAAVMADAICRHVPGVLGSAESLSIDSFGDGLLSAPQFTRPEVWEGHSVPAVLLSGDHGAVDASRRLESLRMTRERRPDLFARAMLGKRDLRLLLPDES